MSEPKFTPGPWSVETHMGNGDWHWITVPPYSLFGIAAQVKAFPPPTKTDLDPAEDMEAQGLANAHLIAAAPDLYAAIDYLVNECDPGLDEEYNPHAAPLLKAKTALAKARGEQP